MSYMCLYLFKYLIYFEITLPAIILWEIIAAVDMKTVLFFSHFDCVFQVMVNPYKMFKNI